MAGQVSPFELVTQWTSNLSQLKTICVSGGFNIPAGTYPLNAFALANLQKTLGARLSDYLHAVKHQFPDSIFDPGNITQLPGDKTAFWELNDRVSTQPPPGLAGNLNASVRSCVNLSVGAGGNGPGNGKLLVDLFKPEQKWNGFVAGVTSSGLLDALGQAEGALAALWVPAKTYIDLILFLESIEPLDAGGAGQ